MKLKALSALVLSIGLTNGALALSPAVNTPTQLSVIEKPWLRDHLPENITAYARIPNLLFYFAPTDSRLKALYEHKNYQPFLQAVTEKIGQQMTLTGIPEEQKLLIRTLATKIVAPVEVMIGDLGELSAPPSLRFATKLSLESPESLDNILQTLFKHSPIKLSTTATGQGEITTPAGPGYYAYDHSSGRLLITFGEPRSALTEVLYAEAPSSVSPIAELESEIDATGHGLFAWVKPQPMYWEMLPIFSVESTLWIHALQLQQIRKAAVGFGVGEQRPKVKAIIDMPNVGLRQLIPSQQQSTAIAYAGQIDSMAAVSLPDAKQLENMIKLLSLDDAEVMQGYQQGIADFEAQTGLSFATLMQVIGNQAIFFEDDNGGFMTLPATVEPALTELLATVKAKAIPIAYRQQTVGEKTLHHVSLNKLAKYLFSETGTTELLSEEDKALAPLVAAMYFPVNHFYWIKEGDNLVFSTLPQPLLARSQTPASGTLQTWLDEQHQSIQGAFFSGSFTYRNLSQKSYYNQLGLLRLLADMTDTPLAIEQFPIANTLSLPKQGTLALSINNAGDALRVEYSSQNGLNDLWEIINSSYVLPTVGILAAIAIPAYQDYTERAKAHQAEMEKMLEEQTDKNPKAEENIDESPVYNQIDAIVTEIERLVAEGKPLATINSPEGKAPELATLNQYIKQLSSNDLVYMMGVESGVFVVSTADSVLVLSPTTTAKGIEWECIPDNVPKQLLPAVCR